MLTIGIYHRNFLFAQLLAEHLKSQNKFHIVLISSDNYEIQNISTIDNIDLFVVECGILNHKDIVFIQSLFSYKDDIVILAICEENTNVLNNLIKKHAVCGVLNMNATLQDIDTAINSLAAKNIFVQGNQYNSFDSKYKHEIINLTKRELEILGLFISGNTLEKISKILNISMNTVKTHKCSINAKLNVHSTQQLIVKARELKLI